MIRFLNLSLFVATFAALSACGKGGDNNGTNVTPYPVGAGYYNCVPGQPCASGLVLTNNMGQPLRFSGRISLDSAQSKSIVDSVKTFQQQMSTGYAWNFCFGSGGRTMYDRGVIALTASQVSGPASFHVELALGRDFLFDPNPRCPSGATIIAEALLMARTGGKAGSILQFYQFGHSFTIVSDVALDGTNPTPDGVRLFIDGQSTSDQNVASPFGTIDFHFPIY